MTDDQKKTLNVFESRVRQLMFMYDNIKKENDELKELLSERERQLREAGEAVKEINAKYDNLKMARIISVSKGELKGAKARLSRLIREVEKCIAMLNK